MTSQCAYCGAEFYWLEQVNYDSNMTGSPAEGCEPINPGDPEEYCCDDCAALHRCHYCGKRNPKYPTTDKQGGFYCSIECKEHK